MKRRRWHWPLDSSVVTLAVVFAAANLQAGEATLNEELLLQSGYGDANEVSALLKQGADPNARRKGGTTPLHIAARSGHPKVMHLLIDAAADVNAKDQFGRTALVEAAYSRSPEAAQLLLASGAEPSPDALAIAAAMGREKLVHALLDAGLPPDAGLRAAALGGQIDLARMLIEKGASAGGSPNEPTTPLHGAAGEGDPDMVKLLLDRNADPNAQDEQQRQTPLHRAISGDGDLRVVKLLVEAGAKLDRPNVEGITPVRLAAIRGEEAIHRWLVKHSGGKEPAPAADPDDRPFSIAEVARDLSSKDSTARKSAIRRLALNAKTAMPEVLETIEAGTPIELFYEAFPAMGPEAEVAIPLLAKEFGDKKHGLGAFLVILRMGPEAVDRLSPEHKEQAADSLYDIIVDPSSDVMGGFAAQMLPALGESAVPTILRLLEHEDSDIRASMAREIARAKVRNEQVAARLRELLLHDPSDKVRTRSARALLARDADRELVRQQLWAMITRPPRKLDENASRQRQLEAYESSNARREAAVLLASFGPDLIDDLLPLLTPIDGPKRGLAMVTLQSLDSPAIPRLIELLDHDDPAIAISAGVALNRMRRPAVPALVDVLKSGSEQAVLHSCSALWWIGRGAEAALETLLDVAGSDDRSDAVRLAAARAALKISPAAADSPEIRAAMPVLIRLLESGSFRQQGEAASALGAIGPPAREALPLLRQRLTLPAEGVDSQGLVRDYIQREAREAISAIEQ